MNIIDNFIPVNYELFKKIVQENPSEKRDYKVHYFMSGDNTILLFKTENWNYRCVVPTEQISDVDKKMGFFGNAVEIISPPDSSSLFAPIYQQLEAIRRSIDKYNLNKDLEEIEYAI